MGPAIASTALLFTSSGSSLKIGAVKSSVELSVAAIVGKSRKIWFVVTQLLSSQFLFVPTVINLGIIGFFCGQEGCWLLRHLCVVTTLFFTMEGRSPALNVIL